MAGDEECSGKQHFNRNGSKHPHPVALEDSPACTGVKTRQYRHTKKPFWTSDQRLLPAPETSANARRRVQKYQGNQNLIR
jgi:hypothetical protein